MGLCESRPEAAQAKRVPPVSPMEIVRGSSRTLFDHGHGSGLQRTPSVAEVKMETALQDLHQIVDIADVTVVRKIGEGAFGCVYLAKHNFTEVACKSIGDNGSRSVLNVQEVNVLREVVHPNVVQFLGVTTGVPRCDGEVDVAPKDSVWLIMEFCGEGDVYSWLHDESRTDYDHPAMLRIAYETSLGLLCIHDQHEMAHLDLKSGNILLHGGVAKIADMGFAGRKNEEISDSVPQRLSPAEEKGSSDEEEDGDEEEAQAAASTRVGTPEWMAPEMFEKGTRDRSVDLYSFAVILWELLTRQRPCTGFAAAEMPGVSQRDAAGLVPLWASNGQRPRVPEGDAVGRPRVPSELRAPYDVLMKACWAQEPAKRPAMRQVVQQLEKLQVVVEQERWRTTLEVRGRFEPRLHEEATVHRKRVRSWVRRAIRGENVVTTIDGAKETEYTVANDSSWVVCGAAAGEYYVLSQAEFEAAYIVDSATAIDGDGDSLSEAAVPASVMRRARRHHARGFKEYSSKRTVSALIATEEDIAWLQSPPSPPGPAHFMASWGEAMLLEAGDYMVTTYPSEEPMSFYRVEVDAFEFSYEPVKD